MEVELKWNDLMAFDFRAGGHSVPMDAKAPIGRNTAPTPKELVVAGLCGCTGMDVIALMRKWKQEIRSFSIKADISLREKGHPAVFTAARLNFYLEGAIDAEKAVEAVRLSQTEYCGVSAMLAKAFPITWEVFVNGLSVATGEASFSPW